MVDTAVRDERRVLGKDLEKLRSQLGSLMETLAQMSGLRGHPAEEGRLAAARHRVEQFGHSIAAVKDCGRDALVDAKKKVAGHPLASLAPCSASGCWRAFCSTSEVGGRRRSERSCKQSWRPSYRSVAGTFRDSAAADAWKDRGDE